MKSVYRMLWIAAFRAALLTVKLQRLSDNVEHRAWLLYFNNMRHDSGTVIDIQDRM